MKEQVKYIDINGYKVKLSIFEGSELNMIYLEKEAKRAYKHDVRNATFRDLDGIKLREWNILNLITQKNRWWIG